MESGNFGETTEKRGRRGSRGHSGDGMKSEMEKPSLIYSINVLRDYNGVRQGVYTVPNHIDSDFAQKLIQKGFAVKVKPAMLHKYAG
jgi:hypothetical protein